MPIAYHNTGNTDYIVVDSLYCDNNAMKPRDLGLGLTCERDLSQIRKYVSEAIYRVTQKVLKPIHNL